MKNKNIYLGGSIVIGLMLVMTVFWIVKATFSNPTASNQLVISCPEVVSGGETITCNVYANVVDTTVLSVNANYQFDDVITYKGGLEEKTQWDYKEDEQTEANPVSLGDKLKQTFAKVDKANKEITI